MGKSLTTIEKLLDAVISKNLKKGRIKLTYPSGATRSYGSGDPLVKIRAKRLPLLELRNPAMFLGESYMRGDLEISDLAVFFRIISQNPAETASLSLLQKLPKRQRNTYRQQRKHIKHHYDIGNDYYKLWLDKTLTYSCAYFLKPSDSIELAQRQKIDHLLRKLQLQKGQTLLDIGCGWGHLAVAAAEQYGAKVLGITLSEEQLKAATKLAASKKVSNLVEFKLLNYQDVPEDRKFDRIISVGMFEHAGRNNHGVYFDKVKKLLAEDGISVLHTITDRLDRKISPWIDKYIFPGGHLPTVDGIEHLLAERGLWSIDREDLWQHYAMTLEAWHERHRAHQKEITAMYDETFYRMQDFWLAGSTAAFSYGDNGLNQFIFTAGKPTFATWPLSRSYLYR